MNRATLKCCGKQVKLADNAFMQQKLSYFRPSFRPRVVLPVILAFGLACAAICVLLIAFPGSEMRQVYSTFEDRGDLIQDIVFTASKTFEPPVFLMYEAYPFVGGNRFYRNSISPEQFLGKDVSKSTLDSECSPTDSSLDPCGLMYMTRFNDTFTISDSEGRLLDGTDNWEAISYPREDKRYKSSFLEDPNFGHLANWMRPSGTSSFRKTYLRIDEPLISGQEYNIHIEQNWPLTAESPDAYKAVVILQPGMVGSPNMVLIIMSGIIGAALLLSAIILFLIYVIKPSSKKYDMFKDVTQHMGIHCHQNHTEPASPTGETSSSE